jgi:hypothetical protein
MLVTRSPALTTVRYSSFVETNKKRAIVPVQSINKTAHPMQAMRPLIRPYRCSVLERLL